MKLTQRQESFCLEYFRTKHPGASYIKAGYSPKHAGIDVHKLLKNPRVQERLAQLNQVAETDTVLSVTQRKERLSEIINSTPLPENIGGRDRVLAIAELNRMEGSYPPEKHAVLGDIQIEVVYRERSNAIQRQIDEVPTTKGEEKG